MFWKFFHLETIRTDVMLLLGNKVAGFALALPSGKTARYAVLWENFSLGNHGDGCHVVNG